MPNCVMRWRAFACAVWLAQLCWACTNAAEFVVPVPQLLTEFDPARAAFPIGLDAFSRLVELPMLKRGVRAYGSSSTSCSAVMNVSDAYDANDDYSNYLASPDDERVLLDVTGAGAITRFWHTDEMMEPWAAGGSKPGGADITYNVYFDGESQPTLQLLGPELWSGRLQSFPAPLALDAVATSGGAVTYRPITFAQSIRVTARAPSDYPRFDYYNIGYALVDGSVGVPRFDTGEDAQAARAILEHAGDNPIPKTSDDAFATHGFDLMPGETVRLGPWAGPGLITELTVDVPDMRREEYPAITEDGRSTRKSTRFELAIAADATSVRLVRRLDDAREQAGDVYVDDEYAGRWVTSGDGDDYMPTRVVNAWLDSAFEVPPALTAGKERLRVRIEASPDAAGNIAVWTEFRYRAESNVDGGERQTDELDVGDPESEAAHAYAIEEPEWSGSATYRPLEPIVIDGGNDARALGHTRLQIFWDDSDTPAVDAPFSEFFGTGAGFVARVQSLMLGHAEGHFYCYFPMPFERSARIVLVHPLNAAALQGLTLSVRQRRSPFDRANVGYFHAEARSVTSTVRERDYEILTARGQGHFVGVNLILPGVNLTLEGDEHIFVDGLRSPSITGTGTEDYFNGGWYFSRGPFSSPFSGSPERARSTHPISAYRFHMTDYIPFRSSIRVAIEHDGVNANQVPYASVAYYYANPEQGMTETDAFEPAHAQSAAAHGFNAGEAATTTELAGRFLNDALPEEQTYAAVSSVQATSFKLAIDPDNSGVVVRRLFDQAVRDQRAEVYVDSTHAGTWYAAGGDDTFRWREDEFWIPADLTRGQDELEIRLEVRSPSWNAAQYRAFKLAN
jgi:hypothetical protein